MQLYKILVFFTIVIWSCNLFAKGKIIFLVDNKKYMLSIENISANKNIEKLKNVKIQAYPDKKFDLTAIKLRSLFDSLRITPKGSIKIIAKDNFYAYVTNKELNNSERLKATPYLVVQENNKLWPKINGNYEAVGSFSLIWIGVNAKDVSREKWVRNISTIDILEKSVEPELKNAVPVNLDNRQKKGYKIFTDNCAGCHSLNLKGQLNIGPDLNFPMNPLEYYSESVFKSYIRDPQSIRYYKNAKMEGFGKELISEQELNDLISFMNLMKMHKK